MGSNGDAGDPCTPSWFVGDTPGPVGHSDHADPNGKMCHLKPQPYSIEWYLTETRIQNRSDCEKIRRKLSIQSAEEKLRAANADLARAANAALLEVEGEMESHEVTLKISGIGLYQGTDYSPSKKQRADDVAKASKAGISITETSCITLLRDAVMAYRDALLRPWGSINLRAIDAGDRGTVLLKEFRRQAGATTVYIAAPNDKTNLAEARRSHLGPQKARTVRGALTKHSYDVRLPLDKFVGRDDAVNKMGDVPFAIGLTVDDWGLHTFVFGYGNVYEVHYDKGPTSPRVFEKSPLKAFMTKWGSVVLAVPPGPWTFGR